MKIYDIIKEDTTSGSIAIVNSSVGGMQRRNPNGTAINALDQDINIFGKNKQKKRKKK